MWEDERLEYNGLRADPRTPMPLQSYLGSYKLPTGLKTHAFAGGGTPLSRWLWAGGESAVRGREVPDRVRLSLILDLLDGLNFLHGRGSAHLSLSADVLYVQNGGDAGGIAVGAGAAPRPRLQFVGLGAAIRLQVPSGRKTFQMSEAGTPFYAPELLDGALIETNLRALLRMDAWAAGVLIAMIAGSRAGSPFEAAADWGQRLFSTQAAVKARISEREGSLGPFLLELDADGGGFLFRHGWLARVLLGLLTRESSARLTVRDAWLAARDAAGAEAAAAAETAAVLAENDAETAAAAPAAPDAAAPSPPAATSAPAPSSTPPPAVADAAANAAAATAAADAATAAAAAATAAAADAARTTAAAAAGPPSPPPRRMTIDDAREAAGKLPVASTGSELDRFRRLAAKGAQGEPFRSLEAMLNIGAKGGAYVTMEPRPWAGVKNYGEVIGFRNRADGDRWDVFVPGLPDELPFGEPLKLRGVLGVVLIKGGNHKLAVSVERDGEPISPISRERVASDVREFMRVYQREHPGTSAARINYLDYSNEELDDAAPPDVAAFDGSGGQESERDGSW